MSPSTSAPPSRADALFASLKALPPDEQGRAVREISDPDLRAEVGSLLESLRNAPTGFLQAPAISAELLAAVTGPDLPVAGERIDGFTLQRVLGAGGMGVVYEALQENPPRAVGLKIFRAGLAGPSALARFTREVEILGYLNHPNVAQVYQAGTFNAGPHSIPYFAMELVHAGRTITAYCDDHRLDVRRRLELFAKVCDGVHHGHQKGVIHRDLKPANVLVGADGEPKIIDFGVARLTEVDLAATQQTTAGDLIGTVTHMSPEQFAGDPKKIDVRSDVYSLGVLLFELLTGALPHDVTGLSPLQAAKLVCEQPPRRASAVRPNLRRNLDSILSKALDLRADARYASAAHLAQDIRRHLSGEPIEARLPTVASRAARWIIRHPIVATFAACSLIAAATAAGIYNVAWHWGLQPHSVALVSTDGGPVAVGADKAILWSRAGLPLHTWLSPIADGIRLAALVPSPDAGNGAPLVLIGRQQRLPDGPAGGVDAYDVRDLTQPVWVAAVGPNEPLPNKHGRTYSPDQFVLHHAELCDVFAESPGDELVVAFVAAPFSQCIVRVYDLTGHIRQEFWHDGVISDFYSLPNQKRLLLAGINSDVTWSERGVNGMWATSPHVCFAVRTEWDRRDCAFIPAEGDGASSCLCWYRCVLPADSRLTFNTVQLGPPRADAGPQACAELSVTSRYDDPTIGDGAGVSWTIDQDGIEVDRSRYPNEGYIRNQAGALERRLLHWSEIHLGVLPAIRDPD